MVGPLKPTKLSLMRETGPENNRQITSLHFICPHNLVGCMIITDNFEIVSRDIDALRYCL